MALQRLIGFVLVVLGIAVLLSGEIRLPMRKTVIDAGPIEVTKTEHTRVPYAPVAGIVMLIGGIALIAVPSRRRI